MNAHKGLNILNVLAGILIIVGVNTFAHICTMMEGPCAKTKTLAIAVAAVLQCSESLSLLSAIKISMLSSE